MENASLYLDWVNLDSIQYALQNPKLHALDSIVSSIQRYSFTSPPIIDERTGRLVAGQGRIESLRAMKKNNQPAPQNIRSENGAWLVPVLRGISFKDDNEAQSYLLDDNSLSLLGGDFTAFDIAKLWNEDEYLATLQQLAVADALPISVDEQDLSALYLAANPPEPEQTDVGELVDRAEELQKKWQVKRGDIWQCGKHRVMCGDSTNAEDVARLMAGEKAGLVATSPPYFNQREYTQWKTYEDYLAFVALIVGETSKHILDDAIFAVNIGSDEQARRWMPSDWWTIIRDSDANWLYRECIAWVKAAAVWNVPRSMHIETGHYFPAQRWEVILVVSRGKHPKFEQSDRDAIREFDENVWQIAVVSGNEQKAIGHNAPFPIEIPRRLIMAYTTKDKIVYEPFVGSGSTIAACEGLGRIGRGLEIAEKYVSVCLERLSLMGLSCERVVG